MAIANTAIAVIWAAFWLYWLVSALGAKKSAPQKGYFSYQVIYRLVMIVIVIVVVKMPGLRRILLAGNLFEWSPIIAGIGIFVCVLGLGFAVWARVHIGRNWGMPMSVREEPELVTTGPYRWVRHPIYGGIFVALLGSSLVAGKICLVILVLCLPYFVYSAVKEEHLMTERFPEAYPEYKKQTKRFIPFIV